MILRALLAVVVLSVVAGEAAPLPNSWTEYAPDPGGYHVGWGSAHWIPSEQKILVWGGHSHNYKGNNSVRAFDPVKNRWEFWWPNDWTKGVQNRDNHVSFFVPNRSQAGEFWVLGGSYTTAPGSPPGTNFGGRFDIASRSWVNRAESPAEFAEGLVNVPFGVLPNPAHDWCPVLNTGVMFGGSAQGNASDVLAIIEPASGGSASYRYWSGIAPGGPPARAQVRRQGVCVGSDFYVYGGTYQRPDGQWVAMTDLWKLQVPSRKWTQLASGGPGGAQLVMTYDSLNNVLVIHGGMRKRDVQVYHIDTNRWEDMTPTMKTAGAQPWRRVNHTGVYAPTVNQHIYTGGNTWNEDGTEANYAVSSLTVSGYTYAAGRASAASRADAAVVPASASGPRPPRALDIPLRTWIARPLPAYGKGPCPTGCKHMRLAHNPDDGRVYFLGGDYGGPIGMASGRNELYSYSIAQSDWRLEYPYCGPPGVLQPAHPDEVGWVYDRKRKVFWMVPGFLYGDTHATKCPEPAPKLVWGILTFDPATRRWNQPSVSIAKVSGERGKFAQYDPTSDIIISFRWDGGMGSVADVFDIKANAWSVVGLARDTKGAYINNARLTNEYTAMDGERRVIYVISPLEGRLLRYNIDAKTMTYVADTPVRAELDTTIPVWDSVSRVLLWPQLPHALDGYVRLHVYHPDTNTWEQDVPVTQPTGLTVRGNSAVFDPIQNALLLIGGLKGGDVDPAIRHFFLYRYGNASPGSRAGLEKP